MLGMSLFRTDRALCNKHFVGSVTVCETYRKPVKAGWLPDRLWSALAPPKSTAARGVTTLTGGGLPKLVATSGKGKFTHGDPFRRASERARAGFGE